MSDTIFRELGASSAKSSMEHAIEKAHAIGLETGYKNARREFEEELSQLAENFETALCDGKAQMQENWDTKIETLRMVIGAFCESFSSRHLSYAALDYIKKEEQDIEKFDVYFPQDCADFLKVARGINCRIHPHDSIIVKAPSGVLAWQIDELKEDLERAFMPIIQGKHDE